MNGVADRAYTLRDRSLLAGGNDRSVCMISEKHESTWCFQTSGTLHTTLSGMENNWLGRMFDKRVKTHGTSVLLPISGRKWLLRR